MAVRMVIAESHLADDPVDQAHLKWRASSADTACVGHHDAPGFPKEAVAKG